MGTRENELRSIGGNPDLSSLAECRVLVQAFYERVREDALLGPVFAARIAQEAWPQHLERMAAFWATVLFATPLYRGNPLASHSELPITGEHFDRWLWLWSATLDDLFAGPVADEAKQRARRMGSRLRSYHPPPPHSRLVPHDIRLARLHPEDAHSKVVATVECERRGCTLRIETCAQCERFARVETHEAGYIMLCRSTDSEAPPAPIGQRPDASDDSDED